MKPIDLLRRNVATAFFGRFSKLRPSQEAAIKPLTEGKNLVLASGTGSGKTEAVLAPILSRLWVEIGRSDSLHILYIAPTKALVNDLEKRLYPILDSIGLTVGIRHGDKDDLASGPVPNLLITTPESLDVLLFRDDQSLSDIKAVVIDEVHLLYNSQRGLQLSILINRLRQRVAGDLQWAALSATVGNPENVRDFLFGQSTDAVFLQFPAHRTIDAKVVNIENESAFLSFMQNLVANTPRKLLLFANSRKECDRLAAVLLRDKRLASAVVTHYSSLSPEVRRETERQFSSSNVAICIATSTLELGIDIGDIDAVILWGVPSNVESFLQKIGRSNRRQNKTNVICLVPDQSENVAFDSFRFVTLIDAAKNSDLPKRAPYELFGAIGQQFLSVIASGEGAFVKVVDLFKLVVENQYITRQTIEAVLLELAKNDYLKPHGFKNRFGGSENLYKLVDLRMIYGNFGSSSQEVNVFHLSKIMGHVPAINLLRVRRGNVVNFAGKCWKVSRASPDGIWVIPAESRARSIGFVYPGPAPGFDPFLANKMWNILHSEAFPNAVLSNSLRNLISQERKKLRGICEPDQIPFVKSDTAFTYFTFGGYLVNKAIALFTKQACYKVTDILITASEPIEWASLPTDPNSYREVFQLLFEPSADQSVFQSLLPAALQVREFLQDWLKDESVREILRRLSGSEPVRIQSNDSDLLASLIVQPG